MSERTDFSIKGRRLLATPYHYTASGLANIFLLNGVTETTTGYGPMVHIDNINGLHRAIGLHIAEKPEPIIGTEFRFLRRQLALTQEALANRMHVSDQTIANYEKGKTGLGPADPFLRALYLVHVLPDQTRVDVLKPMVEKGARRAPGKLPDVARLVVGEGWQEGGRRRAA
jgi:DNA-binding transcriptional regulator YiaG